MAIDRRRTRRRVADRFSAFSGVVAVATVVVVGQGAPRAARAQLLPDPVGSYGTPWRFSAGISGTETYSDNINLSSTDRRSEFVTEISPSFGMTRSGPRLNVQFSYVPDYVYYARGTAGAQQRNSLTASLNAAIVQNLLYFDASAGIAQSNISPFGTLAADTVNASSNRAETRNYTFGPTLRSRLEQDITYTVGYRYALFGSDSSALASGHSTDAFANFQTSTSFRDIGYGMSFDRAEQGYGGLNSIVTEQASATLTYVLQPTIHVNATGGYDRDRYPATGQPDLKGASYSAGFDWRPSRHTTLDVQFGHRYFGPTASVQLSEAMPHLSVSGTYTRDQTTSTGNGLTRVADPNYQLLDQYYRTTITDPAQRAQAVTAALQQAGLPTTPYATSSFVSNQLFVQARADISVALLGQRNTLTFDVSRTTSQALSNIAVGFDIFDQSSRFRVTTYAANYSYRIDAATTLNATVQKSDSQALTGSGQTNQRLLVASASRQLGRKAAVTVMLRNQTQKGTGADGNFYNGNYHENAAIGSLRVTF